MEKIEIIVIGDISKTRGVRLIGKWWIVIFLLILLSLNFLPLKLAVRLRREKNHIEITIGLNIWLLPLEFNLVNPLSGIIQRLSANSPWRLKPKDELDMKDVSWRRLYARILLFRSILLPLYRKINSFYHKISQPIKIKRLSLYTEIGLEDAAVTAVSVGVIWGLLGFIYPRVSEVFDTAKAENQIAVVPNFQQTGYLRIDYSCIFEFRLGHIMIGVYYLIGHIGEIRKLLRRVSK